jgi:hypothetical protein
MPRQDPIRLVAPRHATYDERRRFHDISTRIAIAGWVPSAAVARRLTDGLPGFAPCRHRHRQCRQGADWLKEQNIDCPVVELEFPETR